MGTPTVPFYGKDSDRLARLDIAYKILMENEKFLKDWPARVARPEFWKASIDLYHTTHQDSVHGDRRTIAQRIEACNQAGATWQKIVNYACATEEDNSEMLERMGAIRPPRTSAHVVRELFAPDFSVVNVDSKGKVRGSCPSERRRYTYDVWVTEGDPRVEEGWYHKASFGDGTRMEMDGFQSGKEISFRCRIIGKDNSVSPWSRTVTMMVT